MEEKWCNNREEVFNKIVVRKISCVDQCRESILIQFIITFKHVQCDFEKNRLYLDLDSIYLFYFNVIFNDFFFCINIFDYSRIGNDCWFFLSFLSFHSWKNYFYELFYVSNINIINIINYEQLLFIFRTSKIWFYLFLNHFIDISHLVIIIIKRFFFPKYISFKYEIFNSNFT